MSLLLGLLPAVTLRAETSAPQSATITIQPVTTAPEQFEVPLTATNIPVGGIESFRFVLDIPADLTIVGVSKTGTAMEPGLIQHSVSGNQLTVAGAIANGITTEGATLIKIQLEILTIADDISYTITGVGRVNEVDLPGPLVSGIASIEMVDLNGTITSWDGKEVSGADVSLTGPSTALNTTTDVSGQYLIRVGKVENQTVSYNWNEAIPTDPYVGEQDASEALKTSVGLANCPIEAGDFTQNGEVTEQDAANFLQIALDPESYIAQTSFVPNDVDLGRFNTDTTQDSTAYLLGDCSGNYGWLTGVSGGSVTFPSFPAVSVSGSTISYRFDHATSAKIIFEGLPEGSKLSPTLRDVTARASNGEGMTASRDNIVVVATAEAGFTVDIRVMTQNPSPISLQVKGRTNESPYFEWEQISVMPEQSYEYIFLPAVVTVK